MTVGAVGAGGSRGAGRRTGPTVGGSLPIRLLAAALFGASFPCGAAADPAGFAFLEVPAGARASAMGGAYCSVASGVDAVFWNPAGLAAAHRMQVLAAHYEFLQTLRHEQFGLALPAFGGAFGVSLRAHYSEAIEERDALGNLLGTFGSHDLDFGIAYGRGLLPGWSMGAGAHYVRERIANSATDTYAFDAGLAWEPGAAPGLRLAVAGTSLGGSPRFVIDGVPGRPVPLPAAVQGGASYRMRVAEGWALLGSMEGRLTRGRSRQAVAGLELASPLGAALRAGWREGDDTADLGLGAGWRAPGWAVDYAFVPYRLDLGDTHRFSLWTQF